MKAKTVKFEKSNQPFLSEPVKCSVLALKCCGYRFSFEKQEGKEEGRGKNPESVKFIF